MKRCPECRRDFYDESLHYCLDDGTALLDGPALADEPATAILHSSEAPGHEPPPPAAITTDGETARLSAERAPQPTSSAEYIAGKIKNHKLVFGILSILIVAAVGFGYIFFANSSATAIGSIAVMPFVNDSGNADIEYLSDGMTETLISSLSQLPNLNVKARSSVFRYKGKETDAKTIGKELAVQAILNGRVIQRGDQLILSLELVDVSTENAIWSQQYNRKQTDLIALQNEVARDVSSKLKTKLSGADEKKLAKTYTANPDAYLLYLKGRYHTSRYTKEGLDKGREYFNQAIAADPQFALAYAGVAENYIAASDWFLSSREALPKAGAAAKKALELDDQVAEAHTSLATVKWWFDWDWPGAEAEFRRAIQLDPNDAKTLEFYGWYLIVIGKIDDGIEQNRHARTQDPLSVETNTLFGQSLYFARRYDQAIEQLRATLDMDQNYWLAHSFLGRSYEQQGKFDDAIAEFQRALQIEKNVPENAAMLAHAYASSGKKGEAEKILQQLKSSGTYVPPYNIAIIYAGLGDTDRAFASLERAYSDRSFYTTWLKCDPQLDSLRSDPRFADLVRRVGFPE
ncbi:MAG: tetratricopeptide repeat protein [Acidobacteriota bacterium]